MRTTCSGVRAVEEVSLAESSDVGGVEVAAALSLSSDSEDDEMDGLPSADFKLGQPPHIATSPPWQSRYCDPAISPRISICAPLSPDEPSRPQIAPIA